MADQIIYGGRPGTSYAETWWQQVFTLFDECFPGLPTRIEAARLLGADWRSVSTPFVLMEGERVLAHAGVIAHPMRLAGRMVTVAGVHAVCSTGKRRREGLARRVLTAALAWADERFSMAKLHTGLPAVYERHGFRAVPTHRFRTNIRADGKEKQRLLRPLTSPKDSAILAQMLAIRTPVSDRCAGADPGWMDTVVASLSGVIETGFRLLEEHDAIVVFVEESGSTLVLDVIAEKLPPASAVINAAPDPERPVIWTFSPDRFVDDPVAFPAPQDVGVFMVRGEWPVEMPFGISPLWEH